jgi:Yip1-like protein
MERSKIGRLLGVLVSPRETFEEIGRHPSWVAALVALVAFAALSLIVVLDRMDYGSFVRTAAAASGHAPDSEAVRQNVSRVHRYGWLMALATVSFTGPFTYLLTALVFWIVFRSMGSEFTYRTSLSVTLHALMPWCVQALLTVAVVLARGTVSNEQLQRGTLVVSSPVILAPHVSPAMRVLLGSLDVFSVWAAVLLVLGFSAATRMPRLRAASAVLSVWAVYVVGKVGLAAI